MKWLRFRAAIVIVVILIVMIGLMFPGSWLFGFVLGLPGGAIIVHRVAAGAPGTGPEPTAAASKLLWIFAGLFGLAALMVGAMIRAAERAGQGTQETVLGIALGAIAYIVIFFSRQAWKSQRQGLQR